MKRIGVLALLILCVPCGWSSPQPLSLLDLTKVREVISIAMSPDGERVAFTLTLPRDIDKNGDGDSFRELYVADHSGNIIPYISGYNAIGKLQWSADSKNIWMLAKRSGDEYVGIYVIALEGGEARRAMNHVADIKGFSLHSEQQKLVFWGVDKLSENEYRAKQKGFNSQLYEDISRPNKLWLADFNNKQTPIALIYDKQHVIDAQFHPDDDLIALQTSPTRLVDDIIMQKTLGVYDISGNPLQLFSHQGKMSKFSWSPNGKHVAVIGTNDPHDPAEGRLLLGKIDSHELVNLIPELPGHVEDVAWLSDKRIGFVLDQGTETLLASKRLTPSNGYKTLVGKLNDISKLSTSKSGKQIALVASSPQHPKEVFWHNSRFTRRLTNSNPWLAERQFGLQRPLSFQARDGENIEGILVSPHQQNDGPLPLIIFVHGGPESHISNGWLNRYTQPVHVATGKGYLSFLPNYRGSTGRGVAFSKKGQKEYAGAEFNDILDAKLFLVKEGLADPDKVGITGASYGGYASAWAATVFSEHFAASVATMGIGDQISKFGTTDIPNEMHQLHAREWPWQNWLGMLKASPIYHAEKRRTPLLLMHGEQDKRVHFSQSIELYRYSKLLGKAPVRLVLYPNEGHGFRHATSKFDYSVRLMRWMDTYLKSNNAAMPPYPIEHNR